MKNAIETSKLSKYYYRGERVPYVTLRDTLASLPKLLAGKGIRKTKTKGFWAIKDINLSIQPGEIIGLIGRNGAGKSTLLKVLSRITPPTKGSAILRGRLGSLLEVGTGFHFELTGRENIYLYGSILGMKRSEISRQFNEIVEFAEVGDFLDTPLKHYSSGMYLRLAFAVAVYLDTEILLVDEVLAVGDVSFQQRSVKKMGEVSKEGKTVIFVSHNMSTISSTCPRSVLLEKGKIIADGKTDDVIKRYLSTSQILGEYRHSPLIVQRLELSSEGKKNTFIVSQGKELKFTIHYLAKKEILEPHFILSLCSQNHALVTANMLVDEAGPKSLKGSGKISCSFPSLSLLPGVYDIAIRIVGKNRLETFFLSNNYISFTVVSKERVSVDQLQKIAGLHHSGAIFSPYSWSYPSGERIVISKLSV